MQKYNTSFSEFMKLNEVGEEDAGGAAGGGEVAGGFGNTTDATPGDPSAGGAAGMASMGGGLGGAGGGMGGGPSPGPLGGLDGGGGAGGQPGSDMQPVPIKYINVIDIWDTLADFVKDKKYDKFFEKINVNNKQQMKNPYKKVSSVEA